MKVNVSRAHLAWVVDRARDAEQRGLLDIARAGDQFARSIQATFTRADSRKEGYDMPGYDWQRVPTFLHDIK